MVKRLHLEREKLLKAARNAEKDWPEHLKSCPECRELVELLRAYKVDGNSPLADTPPGWTETAASIPSSPESTGRVRKILAKLVFDSWAAPYPVGVRGTGMEAERRLSFKAEGINFDLRAERHEAKWNFVARIQTPSMVPALIRTDRSVKRPDSSNLFQWSASRPPREMTLRIGRVTIHIPRLLWKKTRAKKQP